VLIGGVVVSRDGSQTWDCAIKDLSGTGARIQLADGQVIPEHCYFVELKNGTAYEANVLWIRPPLAGLSFTATYPLADLTDPKLQFLRRHWLDRRRR
jgi:hypothetical protein